MPDIAKRPNSSIAQIENLRSRLHALQFRALRGFYSDEDLNEFRAISESAPQILGVTKKYMSEITGLSIGYWRTTKGVQDRPRLSNYLLILSAFSDLCDQRIPKQYIGSEIKMSHASDLERLASITNITISLLSLARDEKERMQSQIPNEQNEREDYEKHLNIINMLIDGLERISDEITKYYASGRNRPEVDRTVNSFKAAIVKWWNDNSETAIDWCIRMPALSASIGMLNVAGANMPIATAVASALIAGPKAVGVLQKQNKHRR